MSCLLAPPEHVSSIVEYLKTFMQYKLINDLGGWRKSKKNFKGHSPGKKISKAILQEKKSQRPFFGKKGLPGGKNRLP